MFIIVLFLNWFCKQTIIGDYFLVGEQLLFSESQHEIEMATEGEKSEQKMLF